MNWKQKPIHSSHLPATFSWWKQHFSRTLLTASVTSHVAIACVWQLKESSLTHFPCMNYSQVNVRGFCSLIFQFTFSLDVWQKGNYIYEKQFSFQYFNIVSKVKAFSFIFIPVHCSLNLTQKLLYITLIKIATNLYPKRFLPNEEKMMLMLPKKLCPSRLCFSSRKKPPFYSPLGRSESSGGNKND